MERIPISTNWMELLSAELLVLFPDSDPEIRLSANSNQVAFSLKVMINGDRYAIRVHTPLYQYNPYISIVGWAFQIQSRVQRRVAAIERQRVVEVGTFETQTPEYSRTAYSYQGFQGFISSTSNYFTSYLSNSSVSPFNYNPASMRFTLIP